MLVMATSRHSSMSRSAKTLGDGRNQDPVDLPCDITLEAAQDLPLGLALLCASGHVLSCALILAHPNHADHVQRPVGVSVATSVEAVAYHLAGGGFYGRDPAEARERSLAAQALRVVAGYEQERRGVVRTDGRQGDKFRSNLSHQPIELHLQPGDLLRESLITTSYRTQRELGRCLHVDDDRIATGAKTGSHGHQFLRR